jgi:hypothetical protein
MTPKTVAEIERLRHRPAAAHSDETNTAEEVVAA